MRVRSLLAILLPILILLPVDLAAQAWTKQEGEAYIKLAYGSSTASEQFSFDGTAKPYADNVDENAFFDRSLYLYTELGLSDQVTIVAGLPYKRVIVRDAAFRYRTFDFGDLQLGARYGLTEIAGFTGTPNSLALNGSLTLPLGYTRNLTPSAGAGQVNLEGSISYGRSFHPTPVYLQAGAGYRHRSSLYLGSSAVDCNEGIDRNCFGDAKPSFGDELFGAIEGGGTIGEFLFLQGIITSTWSLTAPETGFTVANPIPTRQRFVKAGVGAAVLLPFDLSVNLQAFTTVAGRNSVRSLDLFFGIDYKLYDLF